MDLSDRRLVREITLVIIVKLALVAALWWAFVREATVPVDSAAMAAQTITAASSKRQTTSGVPDGQ